MSVSLTNQDLTEKEYNLICHIKPIKEAIKQGELGGQSEYTAIILIPLESTQRERFLNAWLPEPEEKNTVEIPCFIQHPIDSSCRVAIFRRDHRSPDKPYLFVMSKGVEDELLKMIKLGKNKVGVKTFPASLDSEADGSIQTDMDITPM